MIRIEFEDYCQEYYSEIDAVQIVGYEHHAIEKRIAENLIKISNELMNDVKIDDFMSETYDDCNETEIYVNNLKSTVQTNEIIKNISLSNLPVKTLLMVILMNMVFNFNFIIKA